MELENTRKETYYRLVVDSINDGSYYASLFNIGSGAYEFSLSKSPGKYYDSLIEIERVKELLENILYNGDMIIKGDFIMIDEYYREDIDLEKGVKIQKKINYITSTVVYI